MATPSAAAHLLKSAALNFHVVVLTVAATKTKCCANISWDVHLLKI